MKKDPSQLKSEGPYTYPLPGSHGFMLSPHVHEAFFRHLATREPCELLIPELRSTGWWRQVKDRAHGAEPESMWTQEMVAFAFYHNRTTLYPSRKRPFALHCATGRALDTVPGNARECTPHQQVSGGALILNHQTPIAVFDWAGYPVPKGQSAHDPAWVLQQRHQACGGTQRKFHPRHPGAKASLPSSSPQPRGARARGRVVPQAAAQRRNRTRPTEISSSCAQRVAKGHCSSIFAVYMRRHCSEACATGTK